MTTTRKVVIDRRIDRRRGAPAPAPRRRHLRRRSDFYTELGKLAGLVAFVCMSIIGQAELIGEPWRHYVTVLATIAAAVWAYVMHPSGIASAMRAFRRR